MTKEQSWLNFSITIQRMMNIVHLEGLIKAKDSNEYTNQYYIIFHEDTQLMELTGNLAHDLLLEEMMKLSD